MKIESVSMLYTNKSDIMGFTAIFLYDRISFLTPKVQLLVKTLEGRVRVKRYSGCARTISFKRIHVIHYLFTSIFVNSDIMVFTAIFLYDWISFLTPKVQLLVKILEGRVGVKRYSGCAWTVRFKRIHVIHYLFTSIFVNSDIMVFTAIFLYDWISFLTLKVQLLVKTLEGRVRVKRYSGWAGTVRFKCIHVIHYLFTSIFVNSDIMGFTAIFLYDVVSFLTLKVQLLVKTLEGRVRVKR